MPAAARVLPAPPTCCVTPSDASMTMTATSARFIARSARSTESDSGPSLESATLARFRMPAVSISVSFWPLGNVTSVSTASRVVPLMSQTMERSSPQIAFSKLLLPGRQMGNGIWSVGGAGKHQVLS